MLVESKGRSYISDEVVDGKVVKATQYVYDLSTNKYTRVGESVKISDYKEISTMNILAKYTVKNLDELSESENVEEAEHHNETEETVEETVEETLEDVEVLNDYTHDSLKALTKVEQCAICKELGLKGYHNIREEERINMILNAK